MATEKKNDKERSVEERLQNLFQLQTYLSEIDRIKILRGELPNEVKDLEDEIKLSLPRSREKSKIGKSRFLNTTNKSTTSEIIVSLPSSKRRRNTKVLKSSSLKKTSGKPTRSRSKRPSKYKGLKRSLPTISTFSLRNARSSTK